MNKKKICFLASNNLKNDPRVLRLAKGASENGFETIALGFYWVAPGNELPQTERVDGFTIKRTLYRPSKIFRQTKEVYFMAFFIITRLLLAWLNFLIDALAGKKSEAIRKDPPVNLAVEDPIKINSPTHLVGKIIHPIKSQISNRMLPILISIDYYAAMTYQLSRNAIFFKPDIVYANDLDSLWAGYLAKRRTGAKLIFDAHEFWLDMGLQVPRTMIWVFKMSEKYLLKKIDGYITVNEPIIRKTESYYNHHFTVPAIVVYNCPYYQKMTINKKGSKTKEKIKILYQGRYALHRGLEQLALAMNYLPARAELSFRAIKDAPIEKILKQIVKENKLENRVRFLPAVPMKKMVQSARGFDIGVVAYIPVHADNKLCTPNKLFEYMMAGLALAVSDLPVLRFIAKKYKNGVMFNPREPKSIAKALNGLISNQKELRQMQQNSLKAARDPFCWEKQQEKLSKLYRDLI